MMRNSDVLLLDDVFENFRDLCMKNYGLGAACFYTAPGLSLVALKVTGVNLELSTDIDMVLFFELNVRGGIREASMRYLKSNKFLSDFDPNKYINYMAYLDANNIYEYASIQSIPTGRFTWMVGDDKIAIESLLKTGQFSTYQDYGDKELCVRDRS